MRSSLYFLSIVPLFIISCAQKLDREYSTSAYASTGDNRPPYFSCNTFSDETFKGSVWSNPKSSRDQNRCIYLEINESPKELLTNEDLFLQMYLFSITDSEMIYSHSPFIRTIKKFEQNRRADFLIRSHIIDAHLVKTKLKLDPHYFLADHFFEICDIENKWSGLQLVIYQRRGPEELPAKIRITKFLIPPFLIHPEFFKDEKGSALAALHPFLGLIPELRSTPSLYYDYAEEMCNPFSHPDSV